MLSAMLAELPRRVADDLLARLDRAAPGRIEGFYVVGSASMGAFRPGRSDLDFLALVDGNLQHAELRKLRALHTGRWAAALIRDTAFRQSWPLVGNGVYLRVADLARSPLEVTPLAGHVAGRFRVAPKAGFDVNPVTWHVLARHGIALRGPDPERLPVRLDDAELRAWVRANLNSYWREWTARARPGGSILSVLAPRLLAASGVLGAPRLHYTLATGEITTKEAAGNYALEVFEPRWHPVIADALAYWRDEPPVRQYRRHAHTRLRDAAEFVRCVIDAGNRLTAAQPA